MPRFNGERIKKILIVLGVVLFFLLILLFLVDAVYEPPKEIIDYPEGNLADDIFTEQNNNYVENELLPQQHAFTSVPYLVDLPEGNGASIGTGTVYKISDTEVVYMSEYSDPNAIQDVISSQFPSAILSDFVPEYTTVVTEVDKQGYINGFSAEYIAEDISVSNKATKTDAVLMGYMLNLPDNDIYAGNHLWVGIGTVSIHNDNLAACAAYLNAMVNTVRLDEKLDEDNRKKLEQTAEEAAEEERKKQEEAAKMAPVETTEPAPVETPTSEDAPDIEEDIYKVDIPLDENYETVKVDVKWSDNTTSAILELFNPDKTLYFDPVDLSETDASFVIENNDIGNYELRIKGSASCGTIETPTVTAVTRDSSDTGSSDTDGSSDDSGGSRSDSGDVEPVEGVEEPENE